MRSSRVVVVLTIAGVLVANCKRDVSDGDHESAPPAPPVAESNQSEQRSLAAADRQQDRVESAGHRRMLRALERIRQSTDDENIFQGKRKLWRATETHDALTDQAAPLVRFDALFELAQEEVKHGLEREAIDHLEQAIALIPELSDAISPERAVRALFRLGVAWLRYGETRNCAVMHNAESCILPIRGGGVHTDQEGSRSAIHYFQRVLEVSPDDHPLRFKAVWLLNVARMTLGEYPDGVAPEYRIPPEMFGVSTDFPRFENRAPELGIATQNLFGGAVADDFTGDGKLDVLTTTFDTAGQTKFFRNEGGLDFSDRTEESGLKGMFGGLNVIQADYDNDGDLDAFILRGAWLSGGGRHPNSLLANDGHGYFTDVTFSSGLGEVHYPTQTGAWADYDNDGDLDLYVGNEHGERFFDGPCQLFRNDGDGTFTDVAAQAGVDHRGFVKGVIWGDYDNDRYPDLYVSTMQGTNVLYHNNGDGTFTDRARELGVAGPTDSFPVWFFDYDNDGRLDLYVPSYLGETDALAAVVASTFSIDIPMDMPHLYRGVVSAGRAGFRNVAPEVGLTRFLLPMGSNFGDIDNDGFLDFYLGTGYPDYEAVTPNVMYRNEGGRRFTDVTLSGGFGHLQKGHSIAFADFDHDGDLDVFAQMGGAYPGDRASDALYENPGFPAQWVSIELVGVDSNRSAIGARIRADIVQDGQRRSLHRRVNSGGSFGSNPLRQILGLGSAREIEELEIYWPTTDVTQRFVGVAAGVRYRITEGKDQLETLE